MPFVSCLFTALDVFFEFLDYNSRCKQSNSIFVRSDLDSFRWKWHNLLSPTKKKTCIRGQFTDFYRTQFMAKELQRLGHDSTVCMFPSKSFLGEFLRSSWQKKTCFHQLLVWKHCEERPKKELLKSKEFLWLYCNCRFTVAFTAYQQIWHYFQLFPLSTHDVWYFHPLPFVLFWEFWFCCVFKMSIKRHTLCHSLQWPVIGLTTERSVLLYAETREKCLTLFNNPHFVCLIHLLHLLTSEPLPHPTLIQVHIFPLSPPSVFSQSRL